MQRTFRRVGHKGADLIVPGNTPASFDAALAHGVHMIEFDVLPADHRAPAAGPLYLAHDYTVLSGAPTLEEGLAHLAQAPFAEIELDVDLKLPGYEEHVVAALREHGLVERALVSSQYPRSLDRIRALEPGLRLGWSVPRVRRDYTQSRAWVLPALAALFAYQRALPRRARQAVERGRFDAIMAHWRLVTPALVRALRASGGELYVWTVDDADHIRRFERMGVTGVITNDPRLFEALAT